jgi:glycosyltransferase involved in cell wall biosynthesis
VNRSFPGEQKSNTIRDVIRLLLLIPTLDRSGAEKQLTTLATHLPRDAFEVEVVALTRGGPYARVLADHQVPVTILNKRFRCDPLAYQRLKKLLRERQPDLLHTWLFAANAYGRLAAGSKPRFPIVVSERCVDSWKGGWQLWLDRRLAPRTARVVGNSQAVADFYIHQGIPREKLAVIPNGVEIPPALPDEARNEARHEIRHELKIGSEDRVIGYIGRLAEQKRVRDLVWAFELVRVVNPEVKFLIAGDGPERPALEQFAQKLGLEGRVRFLGHREDADRLMQAIDVFWLASGFEGQSNSALEAMAAGKPVVLSDIPPNRELVEHGQSGFLVPVGDSATFGKYARDLLADRDLARRIGLAGRDRALAKFGIDSMVAAYARLYRDLAGAGKPCAE